LHAIVNKLGIRQFFKLSIYFIIKSVGLKQHQFQ